MRLPSKYVWKQTVIISLIATVASIFILTSARYMAGEHSDSAMVVVHFMVPFIITVPLGIFWFTRLEQLELSYRNAVKKVNELALLANVDPLTGVLNRRSFIEQFKAVTSTGINGWFLIADIDYLKDINDQYGHPVGDDAVIAVAEAMQTVLPSDCLIARIGGDEFCAFIPRSSCNNIDNVVVLISNKADKLLHLKRLNIDQGLTVSVGYIAVKTGQSFEDVMSLSDEKLYRKKNERNLKIPLVG